MSYAVAEGVQQEDAKREHPRDGEVGQAGQASGSSSPRQPETTGLQGEKETFRQTIAELQGLQDKMQIAARKLEPISKSIHLAERHRYMIWFQGRMLSWLINGFSQPLHALRDILKESDER